MKADVTSQIKKYSLETLIFYVVQSQKKGPKAVTNGGIFSKEHLRGGPQRKQPSAVILY